jgi:hypothetical protein
MQSMGVPLDLPVPVTDTRDNRVIVNNTIRRPVVPVAPATQANRAPTNTAARDTGAANVFGLCNIDTEAMADALARSAPKPPTVNPAASVGGPGSPQASNPKKRDAPED